VPISFLRLAQSFLHFFKKMGVLDRDRQLIGYGLQHGDSRFIKIDPRPCGRSLLGAMGGEGTDDLLAPLVGLAYSER
jgi:hypothetical protein